MRVSVVDTALFVAIAEIAGVFVGFAALISVTRRDDIPAAQLGQVRAVVTIGLVVIVAAMIPVGLGQYGVSSPTLWSVSSLVFLGLIWAVIALSLRRPENRALVRDEARSSPALAGVFWLLLELPIQVPLVLALIGVFPGQAAAFYTTALVFHLFEAAFVLARFVYGQLTPEPAQPPITARRRVRTR